ncbi:GDP-mannose 4,6-dehydratase [Gammaproteobacteria bacterium]|nr:GDP-mannose 4,6-dehydratase [Gammaproteobacteria bacterium]
MNVSKKRILITGCAGFIGSYLSRNLVKNNDICGIDNLNDYYSQDLKIHRLEKLQSSENFRFHKLSLTEPNSLKTIIEDFDPQIVVNLAAQAGVRYSLVNPQSYLDSNIISFFNLLESIKDRDIEKLIFASSSSVYGLNSSIPFVENSLTNQPASLYAATKQANESMGYSYSSNYGIPTLGLRFFTVYGPMGRPDMAYYKFSKLMNEGQEITIYNGGKMSRDMTFIDDIINGIEKAMLFDDFQSSVKFDVFNLGNNHPVSTWDLIKFIEEYFGIDSDHRFEKSALEVKETWADLSKSSQLLGYKPTISFQEGMKRFLEWFVRYHQK